MLRSVSRGVLLFFGGLIAIAVAMAVAWGPRAAFVFAAFALFAGLIAYAASLGGGVVRDASRGRFKRDDEPR